MSTVRLSAQTRVAGKSPDHVGWRRAREVIFWLLLLGSWQFLAASGIRNEDARIVVESRRLSTLIDYAATAPLATGFLETAFSEDSSKGM